MMRWTASSSSRAQPTARGGVCVQRWATQSPSTSSSSPLATRCVGHEPPPPQQGGIKGVGGARAPACADPPARPPARSPACPPPSIPHACVQGCGLPWDKPSPYFKPFYWQNALYFYAALKSQYPHLRLITSCALGDLAPVEVTEYHVYTSPADMFARRHAFDGLDPQGPDGLILASEYAVTDGGGHGNLVGAVAEAAFALGLQRNPRVVVGGAYAPLLVNANAVPWPTNLIVFDSTR